MKYKPFLLLLKNAYVENTWVEGDDVDLAVEDMLMLLILECVQNI